MSESRLRSVVWFAALGAIVVIAGRPAHATQKFGPLQISGNLQSTQLIRHPDASSFEFIQQRNVARLRLDYDILEGGKFYGRYAIPFIEKGNFHLLWRGVYDSVYDYTPGFVQKRDIKGRNYSSLKGNLNVYEAGTQLAGLRGDRLGLGGLTQDERDTLKFENTIREATLDFKVRGIPLQIRAGKQQIVWGEADNFRMLDRANSLDLTWHFQQEIPAPAFGWDEIRQTFWMVKFLYDMGDIWKLSQNYLEWYWNPGDWRPAKQAFLPRPWGLPFYNPLTNPIDGAFLGGFCDLPEAGIQNCNRLMNDTKLFNKGDWHRDIFDNSQVGVRYHGIMPFGLEFTLNYFYQRWGGDDGTNYAPLRGLNLNAKNVAKADRLKENHIFPAEAYHPYVHTVGASGNYSDEQFTQAVFRMETVFDMGVPFFDVGKVTVIDNPALPGVSKRNMWKGMIGFDRNTWIRPLNKKSTFFITGQFFWHYIVNKGGCQGQVVGNRQPDLRTDCLVGGLDLPSSRRTSPVSYRDKLRHWETLATLAVFSFYRGGSVVPVFGLAIDPTNQFNMEPFWTVDWFLRDDFAVNIAQRYFVTPRGRSNPIFETWGLAGLNAGRSETSLRFTFQF